MGKWCFLPYDFDTAIGINNEGSLVFSYELEDIDQVAGADVFNGQHSVLWVNLRQAFQEDIKVMYQQLRSTGALSYEATERQFEEHQAKWPEAIFNEDAYFKYLQPLIEDNSAAYLSMLQGSKAEQRKWWLYNRYRYLDSKYNAGDALSDVITVRGYAKADITVTPYADIYASVKYGSYLVQQRALRGSSYTLECPLDNVNDTEIYIYSASQLKDVGDLSGLMVGYAEFSLATKLQSLKLGDAAASYSNTNLTDLHLGNNVLLRTLDVRNCPNLTQAVDISGCANVEHVYFDGTGITGINLPVGGILKTLHLPATVTNLTIRNQGSLTDLTIPSYTNISTLRLENVSTAVDSKAILQEIPANSRVRLIGIDWEAGDADTLMGIVSLLDTMRGLDENGNNTDMAQVSGTIHVDTVTGAQVAEIQSKYPDLKVAFEHITSNLYFYNYDGSVLLYTQAIVDGADGAYSGSTPSRPSTAQYTYTHAGWSKKVGGAADSEALKAVTADRNVYAAFTAVIRKYTVWYYNDKELLQTVSNVPYNASATYTGTTPVKTGVDDPELYEFTRWEPTGKNITGNTYCYAQYNYLGMPALAKNWINGLTTDEQKTITRIVIVDDYVPSGSEEKAWDASDYKNESVMAYKEGTEITIAGDGSGKIMFPKVCNNIFGGFSSLISINGFELFDTIESTDLSSIFYGDGNLTNVNLSKLDTRNATSISSMFYNCSKLSSLNLTNFNTSKVVDMSYMFYNCKSLTILDLSNFDTNKVTNMGRMFQDCSNLLSLNMNNLNVNKVTNMVYGFANCISFTSLNLNNWKLSGSAGLRYLFSNCKVNGVSVNRQNIADWNWNTEDMTDIQFIQMFG
ncbi:surface protein [Faecalicatena orotica]|uniref:Surface protein n=1 Tax=Faecalicatena orotica TaxID=1544 RepID=A0A2Y9BHR7_9FIRM|nr:BspA family leucine-rich repeat surface protein [Faecalicatena orotica]PWJ27996.1 surface protein [Faecalicatena orotica]SSA57019.1 surface protein [Faecalicatena orotica]